MRKLAWWLTLALLLPTALSAHGADTDPDRADWTIVLGQALHERPLTIAIAMRNGKCAGAFATALTYNKALQEVDVAGLTLSDGQLRGTVKATIRPDPWVPRDHKPVPCKFTVQAAAGDGLLKGTYRGKVGENEVEGEITGGIVPPRGAPKWGTIELELRDALTGGKAHLLSAVISLNVEGGKATRGRIEWTHHDTFHWRGRIESIDLKLPADAIVGEIVAVISSPRGAVRPGKYTFALDGKIIARSIAGTFKAKLADEELSGGPFFGSVRGR